MLGNAHFSEITQEMGHPSETIQSNLRFSHQTIEPRTPPPPPCTRRSAQEDVCVYIPAGLKSWVIFTSSSTIESRGQCVFVGWWLFLDRGAALGKRLLLSPFLAPLGFWWSEPTLMFAPWGRAERGCVKTRSPRL